MGGHLAAGLGTVELAVALHYVFDTPYDRLIWDVGHQAYPHKVLTGRRRRLSSIKQRGGLAPFPSRAESVYDSFGVGHSSTSISAALGMAIANRLTGSDRRVVAVIGDGAMSAGTRLGGAQPRGQPGRRLARGPERQRHVDLGERRRAVEVLCAAAVGANLLAPARRRQESAAQDAGRLGAGAPLGSARQGHGAAGHAVRGDGLQLHRPDRRPRHGCAGHDARQHAQPSRAAVPARRHPEGQGLRARGSRPDQVARSGPV